MPKLLPTWKGAFITLCVAAALFVTFISYYNNTYSPKTMPQTNYVMEVEECDRNSNTYMLVLVGSHPDHGELRNAIRQSWGNPGLENYKFKLLFLFGKVNKTSQQEHLQEEHDRYGDILSGDFVDSYQNITLRDLMGLKWAVQHCQHVRYILHVDDDIVLDIYKLIDNLEKCFSKVVNLIACYSIFIRAAPLRDGRYAVSVQDYPEQLYPDYCSGWAYVLTPAVAQQIVHVAAHRKHLWMNDVYITGVLIDELSLRHKLLNLSFTYSYDDLNLFVQKFNISLNDEILYELGPILQNATLLLKMHEIYKRRAIKNKFINGTHWLDPSVKNVMNEKV